MWAMRNAYKILVWKPEGKTLLGRPRRKWQDNTEMDLIDIRLEGVDRILQDQERNRWRVL
jgi:tRNA G37 N-methylase TrmD